MHCTFVGNGDKTVVYLHGWGADGGCFGSVVDNLPQYTNVMPDFNGFGKSPMPPQEGWCVADYAEALKNLLLVYNIQRATFVAHSFGGRVALVFAATYPNFCDKLFLFAPAGLRRPSLARWTKVACYKVAKRFAIACKRQIPVGGSENFRQCAPQLKNTFVKVVSQDLSQYAKRVVCPTLIVNGKQDKQTPPWHAKRLNRLIANSCLQFVDGGHFELFLHPKAFAKIVESFVEG